MRYTQLGSVALGLVLITSPASANPIAGVDFEAADNIGWDRSPDDLDPADGITVSEDWDVEVTGNVRNDGGANSAGASEGNFPARLQSDGSWSITIPDTVVLNLTGITFDARGATGSTGAPSGRSGSFGTSLDGGLDDTPLWNNPNLNGRPTWTPVSVELGDALYQGLTGTTVTFYWNGTSAIDFDAIVLSGTIGAPSAGPTLVVEQNANGTDLDFTWNSQAGMSYNLRASTSLDSDPASWPIVVPDIATTPDTNTLQLARPVANPQTFYVVEELPLPPVIVFSENFDDITAPDLPADWTTGRNDPPDTATTDWDLGSPSTVGPAAASSSPNCVGTNLAADYGLNTDIWLRTPPIDLTGSSMGTLDFREFRDIENVINVDLDFGSIRILAADDFAELAVLEAAVEGSDTEWQDYSKALPAEAFTEAIVIEFRFESDDIDSFAGWYIDDVAVSVPGS